MFLEDPCYSFMIQLLRVPWQQRQLYFPSFAFCTCMMHFMATNWTIYNIFLPLRQSVKPRSYLCDVKNENHQALIGQRHMQTQFFCGHTIQQEGITLAFNLINYRVYKACRAWHRAPNNSSGRLY